MDTTETYISMCDCWGIQIYRLNESAELTGESVSPFEEKDFSVEHRGRRIWLPRQDQIQEMLGCVGGNHVGIMEKFIKAEYFWSLEQMWLAFYMKERHSEQWNGKEWVKGEAKR